MVFREYLIIFRHVPSSLGSYKCAMSVTQYDVMPKLNKTETYCSPSKIYEA